MHTATAHNILEYPANCSWYDYLIFTKFSVLGTIVVHSVYKANARAIRSNQSNQPHIHMLCIVYRVVGSTINFFYLCCWYIYLKHANEIWINEASARKMNVWQMCVFSCVFVMSVCLFPFEHEPHEHTTVASAKCLCIGRRVEKNTLPSTINLHSLIVDLGVCALG